MSQAVLRGFLLSRAVRPGQQASTGGRSGEVSGAIRSLSTSRFASAKFKKRPARAKTVDLTGTPTDSKILAGVGPAADANLGADQSKPKFAANIRARKMKLPHIAPDPSLKRPTALDRALHHDLTEPLVQKSPQEFEIPGLNPTLLELGAKVGVVGKENVRLPVVDSVATQLHLPAMNTVADALRDGFDFIIAVSPFDQISLQEIHRKVDEEDDKDKNNNKKINKQATRTNDNEEDDDEDEDEEDIDNNNEDKHKESPLRGVTLGRKIWCDFVEGSLDFRRRFGENEKSPMIRAIRAGKDKKDLTQLTVLDATAGLGQDAFVIAGMGCRVKLLERNPIMYSMLATGVRVGRADPQVRPVLDRMTVQHEDALKYFSTLQHSTTPEAERPDVVFLDPMYPSRKKMAPLTKKQMFVTRKLLGAQTSTSELVQAARRIAKSHVVLKRPVYAPESEGMSRAFKSRSTRFEIFDPLPVNSSANE